MAAIHGETDVESLKNGFLNLISKSRIQELEPESVAGPACPTCVWRGGRDSEKPPLTTDHLEQDSHGAEPHPGVGDDAAGILRRGHAVDLELGLLSVRAAQPLIAVLGLFHARFWPQKGLARLLAEGSPPHPGMPRAGSPVRRPL